MCVCVRVCAVCSARVCSARVCSARACGVCVHMCAYVCVVCVVCVCSRPAKKTMSSDFSRILIHYSEDTERGHWLSKFKSVTSLSACSQEHLAIMKLNLVHC